MTPDQLYAIIGSTVGSVAVVGISLAVLILRNTSRLDTDRRTFQASADADRRAFQLAMDTFRTEMQRLAERQSNVEGRVAERKAAGRGAAAD